MGFLVPRTLSSDIHPQANFISFTPLLKSSHLNVAYPDSPTLFIYF